MEIDLSSVEPDLVMFAQRPELGTVTDLVVGADVILRAITIKSGSQLVCLAHELAVFGHEEPFVEGPGMGKHTQKYSVK